MGGGGGGWGGGGSEILIFWGYEDFVDIFFCGGGGHDKIGQNENILAWQKFQILFGVLDIPDIFLRQTVDAGPNPTYEEKVRVPPPPHTHTHSPWVTVYDEKLLVASYVICDGGLR